MKITAEYLHRKWKSISYYDGGYIQVEVKHPLEWHVGYKEIDQKTLVIVSEKENCFKLQNPLRCQKAVAWTGGGHFHLRLCE